MNPPWGLYLHIPWCRVRCPYCAFVIAPDREAQPERLVDRLLALRARRAVDFHDDPVTIYLGGGTPSRLPADALRRLLAGVCAPSVTEVTIEANPEDVDERWLDAAQDAGVTRVSLGVQTLHTRHARTLGRAHTPQDARCALTLLARRALRVSVDLMFALPDQTLAEFEADLDAMLAYEPGHLSAYGLTYEPGTPFERARERGRLRAADDDVWADMYELLVERCAQHGLVRYEISNFARAGHEAKHNAGYWQGRPYLGLGPGAHSLAPDGRRWVEHPHVAEWLDLDEPRGEIEAYAPERHAADALISGMRGMAGLDLSAIAAKTGLRPASSTCERLAAGGLIHRDRDQIRLTHAGVLVADAVTSALIDALEVEGSTAAR